MNCRYWCFISYSHKDEAVARWLARSIEGFRVPRQLVGVAGREGEPVPKLVRPVFRDRDELPASADLGATLREALEASRVLVVLCSPDSARSRWVEEEILSFKRRGLTGRILAVIVRGRPNAANAAEECFPDALRFALLPDGSYDRTQIAEPIAADLTADAPRDVLLRVIAGVLGIAFDDLKQRHRARQQKQRLWLAAAVLCLGAAFLGMYHWQRQRAEREKQALQLRQTADEETEEGRRTLLAGDSVAAADHLQRALEAAPGRWDTQLMLGMARQRSAGNVARLDHRDGRVFQMQMSGDGRHLLVIGDGRTSASLWELPSGNLLRRFSGSGGASQYFSSCEISPDGGQVLLASLERTLLADISGTKDIILPGARDAVFAGHGEKVLLLNAWEKGHGAKVDVYGLDGKELHRLDLPGPGQAGGFAKGGTDQTAVVGWWRPTATGTNSVPGRDQPRLKWIDISTGKVLDDLSRDPDAPISLSPDGKFLCYLRDDQCWEVREPGRALWQLPKSQYSNMHPMPWSMGGRFVLTGERGTTRVHDATTGKVLWSDVFSCAATTADDQFIAHEGANGSEVVRELATGREVAKFVDQIGWPDRAMYPHENLSCFTPDGRMLLLAGASALVKVWDWRAAQPDWQIKGDPKASMVKSVRFSSDSSTMGILHEDGTVEIEPTGSTQTSAAPLPTSTLRGVWSLAFSPDARRLLASPVKSSSGAVATLHDTRSAQLLATLQDHVREPDSNQQVAVVSYGDAFVTANLSGGLGTFWDGRAQKPAASFSLGQPTLVLGNPVDDPSRIALAKHADVLAAAGYDEIIRCVNLPSGSTRAQWHHPFKGLSSVALCMDGNSALSRDIENRLVLWREGRQDPLALLANGEFSVNDADFTQEHEPRVVAACSDARLRIWSAATGEPLMTLEEQKSAGEGVTTLGAPWDPLGGNERRGFLGLACAASGRWIAAVNDLGNLCLWDATTGRQLLRAAIPLSHTARLGIAPDDSCLVVYGIDGAVRVLTVPPLR